MDAVRAALSNLNGHAQHHHSHAVYRFAVNFVETGSSMELKTATMATRETMMDAAQHARKSADSPALAVTQACARQPAETASALASKHATTATLLLVGMDAVRAL
jgi:hypothetical protein